MRLSIAACCGAVLVCCAVTSVQGQGEGEPFSSCGELVIIGECNVFFPLVGDEILIVENLTEDDPVGWVRVDGYRNECEELACQEWQCLITVVHAVVTASRVEECEPVDLGCGRLSGPHWDGDTCWLWESAEWGRLLIGGTMPGHAHGDSIRVTGELFHLSSSICFLNEDAGLRVVAIHACADTLTATVKQTWGRIKGGYR